MQPHIRSRRRPVLGLLITATVCALAAAGAIATAQADRPPGGSAWVRWNVNAAGKPRGYLQFEDYCSACHAKGPEARPGYEALRAKYHGTEPGRLSKRTDLTPAYIRNIVRHGDTVMPFFRKTNVSAANLDLIIEYLTRNNPSAHRSRQ